MASRNTLWWLREPQPPRGRFRIRWLRYSKPQFSVVEVTTLWVSVAEVLEATVQLCIRESRYVAFEGLRQQLQSQPPRGRFRIRWLRYSKPQFSVVEVTTLWVSVAEVLEATVQLCIRESRYVAFEGLRQQLQSQPPRGRFRVTVAEVLEATLRFRPSTGSGCGSIVLK